MIHLVLRYTLYLRWGQPPFPSNQNTATVSALDSVYIGTTLCLRNVGLRKCHNMNSHIMENSISGKRLAMKLSARDKVIPGYILGFRIPRTGFQSLSVELGIRIPIVSGIPYSKTQDSGFQKQNFPGFWIPDSLPLHGVTCMVIETVRNWYLTIIPRARMGSASIAHETEGRMGYWLPWWREE